jgi:hypothetical protein
MHIVNSSGEIISESHFVTGLPWEPRALYLEATTIDEPKALVLFS